MQANIYNIFYIKSHIYIYIPVMISIALHSFCSCFFLQLHLIGLNLKDRLHVRKGSHPDRAGPHQQIPPVSLTNCQFFSQQFYRTLLVYRSTTGVWEAHCLISIHPLCYSVLTIITSRQVREKSRVLIKFFLEILHISSRFLFESVV